MAVKIKILNHTYELDESDPDMWNGNGIGRSSIRTGKIELLSTAPVSLKHSTLLHEVVHQIADLLDLKHVAEDETTISSLAVALYDFIKQNPKVIYAMLELE